MIDKLEILIKYYIINIFGLLGLGFTSCYITYISGSLNFIKSLFSLTIVSFVTWFGHYLMHNYNKYNPIAKLHKITHHSDFADTFWGKLIEYVIIEFFFFGGGILLILIILLYKKYKYWILDPYVLLFWSLFVPFLHEIYYHMFELSNYHELHHKDINTTYSPEIWDIVFDTKLENYPIDNETNIIPVNQLS